MLIKMCFNIVLIFNSILLFTRFVSAQNIKVNEAWVRYYGTGGEGRRILVDDKSNVIISGTSSYYHYSTVKYSPMGEQLWTSTYIDGGYDEILANAIDNEGNIIVTGRSGTIFNTDITTIKYSPNGEEKWVRKFSGNLNGIDQGGFITVDQLGNVYVAGSVNNINSGFDIILIKYNKDGVDLWHKIYDGIGNGFDICNGIVLDKNQNVIITCSSSGLNNNLDIVTLTYDNNGNEIRNKRYNSEDNKRDYANIIHTDHNNNVYIFGTIEDANFNSTCVIIKYNSSGDEVWVRKFNGISPAGLLNENSIYVCFYADNNIVICKLRDDGTILWRKTPANPFSILQMKLLMDAASNIYVTGTITNNSFIICRFNSVGDQEWVQQFPNKSVIEARLQDAVINRLGNIYISGYILNNGEKPMTTVKYVQPYSVASPRIKTITDVENDQGLEVNIEWYRSVIETEYPNIGVKEYQIWCEKNGNYEMIKTIPAQKIALYKTNVPSLKDSTSAGIFWSKYFIVATTSNVNEYYYSETDSTYSVDNILPESPKSLTASFDMDKVKLTWKPGNDPDLLKFEIYRSKDSNFIPCEINKIGETLDTVFYDESYFNFTGGDSHDVYYLVLAIDDALNSAASELLYFRNEDAVPVELNTFECHSFNNSAVLEWSTITETNNFGFEIQRSNNDNKWKVIGFIHGQGTTSEQQYYTFRDSLPHSGRFLYRINQIDFDGSCKYSKVISLDVKAGLEKYFISQNYPNPFNPTTKIEFVIKKNDIVTIKVYDFLGKELKTLLNEYKDAGNYIIEFDAGELTSGLYFYKISSGSYSEIKKMILIR